MPMRVGSPGVRRRNSEIGIREIESVEDRVKRVQSFADV